MVFMPAPKPNPPTTIVTDPPVKALRRVIPPVRLGGVALDLSVLVLFVILAILRRLVLFL